MKINRIDVLIPTRLNKHKPYLSNEIMALMNQHRFGGEFRNDNIKLSAMPEPLVKVLKELKIKFVRGNDNNL